MTIRAGLIVIALCVAACGDARPPERTNGGCDSCDAGGDNGEASTNDAGPSRVFTQKLLPVQDLDVLFVVDSSGSMAEEQASLVNNFHRFIEVLANRPGGLPNLHVGVISADVGAGDRGIGGCAGSGDNGRLQNPAESGCGPDGAFIRDVGDGAGGRDTNYSGTLSDTFACVARLGIDGCGFEQPLESMRRALNGSTPANDGFLRPQAALAVIIISDEDDCSVSDSLMFDTNQTSVNDPLGPLSSFRCFEFGVVCDDDDPRSPGVRQGCRPRADSPYMYNVDDYVYFLRSLKADPDMIMVATVAGGPTPVMVATNDMGHPDLASSCVSITGEADPAVRLSYFASQFPFRNTQQSICSDNLSGSLVGIADTVSNGVGGKCLTAVPADMQPERSGVQTDCSVADVANFGQDSEAVVQTIPDCSEAATGACYRLSHDSFICGGPELQIDRRGTARPNGTVPRVRCSVD